MKKLCKILPLALILCFMVGCQGKEAMAELEAMKAQAALEEQNKDLVKRLFDELNKANIEILKELLAPDWLQYNPSGTTVSLSREEWLKGMENVYRAFPDLHYDIQDIIAKGDIVIVRTILKMTHKGEWYGIPPTGNKVEVSEIYIIRIKEGKIAEEWGETDRLGAYQQLGMELKPKEE